jgi:hypothetical protein
VVGAVGHNVRGLFSCAGGKIIKKRKRGEKEGKD